MTVIRAAQNLSRSYSVLVHSRRQFPRCQPDRNNASRFKRCAMSSAAYPRDKSAISPYHPCQSIGLIRTARPVQEKARLSRRASPTAVKREYAPQDHRLHRVYGGHDRQLFPSSPRFRLDRRDADHRGARGRRAVRQRDTGGARLSAGAQPEAARSRADEIEEARASCCSRCSKRIWSAGSRRSASEITFPSLSIIGPVMQLFQAYLGASTTGRVGAQHTLNTEYFKRIDALNYTMVHDDGQHIEGLEDADVVLVGVSRTSKTPTSIYLANRGIRTANVPLVPGIPLPHELENSEEAARRQPACDAGATDPDPAEPAARARRRDEQRRLYRSSVGDRRGDFASG